MVSLAHRCLLTLLKSQPCDLENPVIMDQVFGAEMLRMENQRVINKFKKNIKKAKKQILKMSSMKNINLELGDSNKIINQFSCTVLH